MTWMEFIVKIWDYFACVFPPVGMLLLALLIWSEVRAWLTRKRVAVILDAKDVTIKDLTNKTLDAVAGYSKLTNLLEKIVEGLK